MRIPTVDLNARAVVVLGAGATRGAAFVKTLRGALPPLDGDFFVQLQRLSAAKPPGLVEGITQDATGVFGKNFELTMEQYFTHVEQLINIFDDYRLAGRPATNPYKGMRERLMQALAAVMDESIGHSPQCPYHEQLVRSLSSRDALVSFNYDWVIDHALRVSGAGKWNPQTGYGVRAYRDSGADFWAAQRADRTPYFSPRTIQLLKMHGSMHWFPAEAGRDVPRIRLRQRYWHQRGNLRFEIVPPEWNKRIRFGIYKQIWRRARRALRQTSVVAFVGYSLPEIDLPARALFMADSIEGGATPLAWLIIVNPDQVARRRIRQTVIGRITGRTKVLTFDYFEDFYRFMLQPQEHPLP